MIIAKDPYKNVRRDEAYIEGEKPKAICDANPRNIIPAKRNLAV